MLFVPEKCLGAGRVVSLAAVTNGEETNSKTDFSTKKLTISQTLY